MNRLPYIAAIALIALTSCRGGISHKPPVHLVPDMDFQQKIKAQSEFKFESWEDKRGMRQPVAGTIARGTLDDRALETYQRGKDQFIDNPIGNTAADYERGRERYDIYCAVCHDRTGSGQGLVMQRAPLGSFNPIIPHLATEPRLREMKDGELFKTITEGKGTMPAYGHMIPAADRWKIVRYLRALQNRIN